MVAKGKDRTKIQDMTYAIITSGMVSIQDYLCEGSSRLIDGDRVLIDGEEYFLTILSNILSS